MLLTGLVTEGIKSYPEIDSARLSVQPPMFRSSYVYNSVEQSVDVIKSSTAEIRQLFSEVLKVMRCILVLQALSCEAERSFSCLRRLKTYLRSTMTKKRLNNVAVMCNVHKDILMSLPINDVIKDFVSLNSQRQQMFGQTAVGIV